ncbi:MAG: hypothetical protein PUP92_26340 [Rhizonema sp. PD38]|nr:hypothetical protein [Rhizonema sp. PD38]
MTNPSPKHLHIKRQREISPGAISCQNRNIQPQSQTQTGVIAQRQSKGARLRSAITPFPV